MLPLQFFGQNIHFAISLLTSLVFFAVFWLYFDAWTNKKERKELFKWAGALLISASFLVHATFIEQSVLGESIFGNASENLAVIIRFAGYLSLIIGLVMDPLQKVPKVKGLEEPEEKATGPTQPAVSGGASKTINVKKIPTVAATGKAFGLVFVLPVAVLVIAILYLRRATKGLERHLKPVSLAFFLLAAYELTSLAALLRDSDNPNVASLVKAFGASWILEHLLLLAGVVLLGLWVWKYLTKRFLSQLFMIFVTVSIVIFLLTTVSFTYLLMRNVQNSALDNLQTASAVLDYAIDAKKAETRANAESLAQNPSVVSAISAKNHKQLVGLTEDFLPGRAQSSLIITTDSSQVLLRAEDPDRWGDSISSDTLVRRALVGQDASSIGSTQGVLAPTVYIKSAVPVRDAADKIIGSVTVALQADNGFVDGIKRSTGLDSAIYADNIRSATTFVGPDGKSRQIGVKEPSQAINNLVLESGGIFKGPLDILNRPFLAVYSPLRDADDAVVGMLFIGQPQSDILKTAGRSIELTFIAAAILLLASIIPAYFTAKHLSRQLE